MKKKYTHNLNIRLNDNQFKYLKNKLKYRRDNSKSDFIRYLISKNMKRNNKNIYISFNHNQLLKIFNIKSQILDKINHQNDLLSRIGNNLNQTVKLYNKKLRTENNSHLEQRTMAINQTISLIKAIKKDNYDNLLHLTDEIHKIVQGDINDSKNNW